jgi:hypothetical protein
VIIPQVVDGASFSAGGKQSIVQEFRMRDAVFSRFGIPGSDDFRFDSGRFFRAERAMSQPRDDRQRELFRPALEQIIDMAIRWSRG